MTIGKIWTADELLAMSPNERFATVQAGFVTELDDVPEYLVERARADIRAHIARSETTGPHRNDRSSTGPGQRSIL